MDSGVFTVEIDGHRVLVDQARQQVRILDRDGAAVFCDRIQVAAGSLQGLFSAVRDTRVLDLGTEPSRKA